MKQMKDPDSRDFARETFRGMLRGGVNIRSFFEALRDVFISSDIVNELDLVLEEDELELFKDKLKEMDSSFMALVRYASDIDDKSY